MRKYKTLHEAAKEYFIKNPEEIDNFILEIFEDYAKDGDSAALLSELRVIASVKGISYLEEDSEMTPQELEKDLSCKENPPLDSVHSIMQAIGYQLMPKPIAKT